jgi:hypothetical protein
MRFSIRRARVAKSFMVPMVAPRGQEGIIDVLYIDGIQNTTSRIVQRCSFLIAPYFGV